MDVFLAAPNPVLLRQMTEIRDGHRRNANPDMVKIIKKYNNEQLVAISAYQSSMTMPGSMCAAKPGKKKSIIISNIHTYRVAPGDLMNYIAARARASHQG